MCVGLTVTAPVLVTVCVNSVGCGDVCVRAQTFVPVARLGLG